MNTDQDVLRACGKKTFFRTPQQKMQPMRIKQPYKVQLRSDVMSTHLSPGRSRGRKLRCTGCGDPGGATRGPNRRLSLRPESYTGSLSPARPGGRRRWARRSGRSRGCRGRRVGTGTASPRGRSRWGRKGLVRFGVR